MVCQDADIVGAEVMGIAIIPVDRIMGGKVYDEWIKLEDAMGKVGRQQQHLQPAAAPLASSARRQQ